MNSTQPFGPWLRERRKALDLTQEELAHRVGCSAPFIRLIELGLRRPSRQIAKLLALELGVPEAERAEFIAFARGSQPGQHGNELSQQASGFELRTALLNNLPALPTALIGRNEDVTTLASLILREDIRHVTLTGPPGIGKTSLALEVAMELRGRGLDPGNPQRQVAPLEGTRSLNPQFVDGIFWVSLASVTDPALVIPSIARVLDVQGIGTQSILDALDQALKPKHMLLLLDNFEQVIEAGVLISHLLAACPYLKVLVTSREALNVRGEQEFNVSSLLTPDLSDPYVSANVLAHNPAVALFVERARAVDRHFELNVDNGPIIAAICVSLDGVPLAIELVAARTKMLPLKALLARLQDTQPGSRLDLLAGGARDLPNRHRTVRNAIGWSYDLLDNDEQTLFRRLGVFRGGFTLAAAEAICNAGLDLKLDLFEGIAQLLHKSILKRDTVQEDWGGDDAAREVRFTMLETIREYALERLQESGKDAQLHLLHSEYFLSIASSIPLMSFGEKEVRVYNSLDKEYDNLRSALLWAIENHKLSMASQFGVSLSRYWQLRGYFREGFNLVSRIIAALAEAAKADPELARKRVNLLQYAAVMSTYMSDYSTARSMLEESLSISRELGVELLMREALIQLGNVARLQGEYSEAESLYIECIAASQDPGQETFLANSLWALGTTLCERGDFVGAESYLTESLAMARSLGDTYVTSGSLRDLGVMLSYSGKHEEAIRCLEESLVLAQHAHFQFSTGRIICALGFAVLGMGEYERAEELFRESLRLARGTVRHRVADGLEGLAEVELARANQGATQDHAYAHRSAILIGAAESVRRILCMKVIPAGASTRERLIADACSRLGEAEYAQSYSIGRAMSLEEAISYALSH